MAESRGDQVRFSAEVSCWDSSGDHFRENRKDHDGLSAEPGGEKGKVYSI